MIYDTPEKIILNLLLSIIFGALAVTSVITVKLILGIFTSVVTIIPDTYKGVRDKRVFATLKIKKLSKKYNYVTLIVTDVLSVFASGIFLLILLYVCYDYALRFAALVVFISSYALSFKYLGNRIELVFEYLLGSCFFAIGLFLLPFVAAWYFIARLCSRIYRKLIAVIKNKLKNFSFNGRKKKV